MKLLLDTHIFLWALLEPERLPPPAAQVLENPKNELWLSPISLWECLVLAEKGRISLDPDSETWIREVLKSHNFREAPLTTEVAIISRRISLTHEDPADRFLAATARVFELTLVTADRRLQGCPDIELLKVSTPT
jgi:PIN domain nuclease of toxin-antitoxin system